MRVYPPHIMVEYVSPVIHISKKYGQNDNITVCPGSSDSFYIVTYYMKWVTTSWTDGIKRRQPEHSNHNSYAPVY